MAEMYMWTPNPLARFYQRFPIDEVAESGDGNFFQYGNNRYRYVSDFKWIIVGKDTITRVFLNRRLSESAEVRAIKTNSHTDFQLDDLVKIDNLMWIIDDKQVNYISTPKPRILHQYLILKRINSE
jgi:hypothetical protein